MRVGLKILTLEKLSWVPVATYDSRLNEIVSGEHNPASLNADSPG